MQKIMIAAMAALSLTACATSPGGNVYENRDVGHMSSIKYGTLVGIEPIVIQNTGGKRAGIGPGAAGGGLIGNSIGGTIGGGSDERRIGAAIGTVVGGVAGNAAELRMRRQQAYRYTLDLDSGQRVVIVQGDKRPIAQVGQRIRVEMGPRRKVMPL